MKKLYIIGLSACIFAACKPDLKTNAPAAGDADFSRYLAVGNSLTAGFADGSLYRSGQENSYPARLAEQFKTVGGGDFRQPLLVGEAGFPYADAPRLMLGPSTGCDGVTSLGPVPDMSGATAADATNIAAQGPYNNVGIPLIRCIDFTFRGYGFLNPYAARFFTNLATESALDVAKKIDATFFSCWLGSNDVLGYATRGGQGSTSGIGLGDISPTTIFDFTYDSVISSLTATGAKGVLMNIPDITSIPFFNVIPSKGLTLTADQATMLNAYHGTIGNSGVNFVEGANYFLITTHDGSVRMATSNDYVLLSTPQDSLKCGQWGSLKPIPAAYVLDAGEVVNVRNATEHFNNTIRAAAQKYNLAHVDMFSYLKTLSSGVVYNGVRYNAQFVTGGAFSLDGVHLTPRGYALAANYIIEAINAKYNSTIPMTDVNAYGAVKFP